jgi:DNA-directed RNA polymerase specialized sigma24 family protein
MSAGGSVTHWVAELKAGNQAAAQKLWEGYFQRLVGLARRKLQGARRGVADEEDIALSAFASFCRGAGQGRFPQLRDRNHLWPLLFKITARKALDLIQHERRQKRGGGTVRGESALAALSGSATAGIDGVIGPEPTPEFTAQVAEEYRRLLERLNDPDLRSIAVWKMEGCTNAEIADRLGCVTGTVERKLRLIRTLWGQEDIAC